MAFILGVGALAGAGAALLSTRRRSLAAPSASQAAQLDERSTTSSAGGGAAAYETRKAVDEYLQFHFGADEDILPYACGPKASRRRWALSALDANLCMLQEALHFTARLAALCERHCSALMDITGERGETAALDIGCAVGGASIELARSFQNVLGIDYSHAFVHAAQVRPMEDSHACTGGFTGMR